MYHIHHGGEIFRQNGRHENSDDWSVPMPASSDPDCRWRCELLFDWHRTSPPPAQKVPEKILRLERTKAGAHFLQGLQVRSAVFCQSYGNDENDLMPLVAGGSENANDANGSGGLFYRFPPLHFVQFSHKDGEIFRQTDRWNEVKNCSEKEQSRF